MKLKSTEKRTGRAPIVFLILEYLIVIIYYALNGKNLLNSDAAAEMMLSNLLNKTGGIVTNQWYYSTELRVLNTQLVYKLSLRIFPTNWHAARTLSIAIFLLILIACGCFLIWAAGLSRSYLWWVCTLIVPFGQWYGWNVIFCSYYVPHIAISLLTVGLMMLLIRHTDWSRLSRFLLILVLGLLCFGAGLGGVRQLMICDAPAFVACLIPLFYHCSLFSRDQNGHLKLGNIRHNKDMRLFLLGFWVLVTGLAGYVTNARVLANRYSFENLGSQSFSDWSLTNFVNVLGECMSLFGWQEGVDVLSMKGISCIIATATVVMILLFCIRALLRIFHFDRPLRILVLICASMFAVDWFFYSTMPRYNLSYWVPVLPFLILLSMIGIQGTLRNQSRKFLSLICYAFWLFFCSICTMRNPVPADVPSSPDFRPVADYLIENNYTQGIATFWGSDLTTELSDGSIEMWTVKDYGTLEIYKWLQKTDHTDTLPEGKFFLIYDTEDDDPVMEQFPTQPVFQTDQYRVYVFDSIEQFQAAYASVPQ